MKKIDSIVVSTKEPSTDNLWLKDNTLNNYHNGSWKPIEASKEGILTIPENPEEGQMPTVNSDGKVIWSITHNTDAEAIRKDLEKNKEDVNQLKISVEEARLSLFIDMWNTACGTYGQYNTATGFFELNGLTDITYEEALKIDSFGAMTGNIDRRYSGKLGVRTFYPLLKANITIDCTEAFSYNTSVEVINGVQIKTSDLMDTFSNCTNLRSIQEIDIVGTPIGANTFKNCSELENLKITRVRSNFNVQWSPKLTSSSFLHIINKATNEIAITITVHPDVYAKLTGDTTNAAAAALTLEELAQWQQVFTEALQKKIQFTTI